MFTFCFIVGILMFVTEAASSAPFVCDGVGVCNLDDEDQYCTADRYPRCEYCHNEDDHCFTKRMAFNCTTYCRELDKQKNLAEVRANACPTLGNVTNGFHNASDSPQPGEIVLTTCYTGYRVAKDPLIKCLEYGIWSDDIPSCMANECPALRNVANGFHNASDSPQPRETVLTTCYTGYRVEGDPVTMCLEFGIWSNDLPSCIANVCPALRNVVNGFHNASASPQSGEIVLTTCNTGYIVAGDPLIKCLEYGIWSNDLPSCTEVVCMTPAVDHGKVTSSSQMTTVGSMITYACDEGYTPSDLQAQALCLPDGAWKSLSCDKVQLIVKEPIWSYVAIGVLGICVISFIANFVYMYRRLKTYKDFQKMFTEKENSIKVSLGTDTEDPSFTKTPKESDDENQLKEVVTEPHYSFPKEDKKLMSTPLPPRNTNVEPISLRHNPTKCNDIDTGYPINPHSACPQDDSLPSSTASLTHQKDVTEAKSASKAEAPRKPNTQSQAAIRIENGSPSNIHIHVSSISNNHNNNHNNNISRHPSNSINSRVNIQKKEETRKREETNVPDNTPYPTQASDVGESGYNTEDSDIRDSEAAGGGNSDDDTERRCDAIHSLQAHPVDETKPGKLALKDNTVSPNDVKRNSHSSKM